MHTAVVQKACESWQDLQEEMKLWKWDQVCTSKWQRIAKMLNMLDMDISCSSDEVNNEPLVQSWAKATRKLRELSTGDCESEENGKVRIPRDRNWLPSRPFSEAYIAHVRVSICVIMRQYSMEYKNG